MEEQIQYQEQSFHLAVSDFHDIEIRRLRCYKYVMHLIMFMCAFVLSICYITFYYRSCFDDVYK